MRYPDGRSQGPDRACGLIWGEHVEGDLFDFGEIVAASVGESVARAITWANGSLPR